jgi:hypothetical protein
MTYRNNKRRIHYLLDDMRWNQAVFNVVKGFFGEGEVEHLRMVLRHRAMDLSHTQSNFSCAQCSFCHISIATLGAVLGFNDFLQLAYEYYPYFEYTRG